MNKLITALSVSALLITGNSLAATKHIHAWDIGGSANWRTDINLSNTCGNKDADVTMKFWNRDGTPFSGKNIYLIDAAANVVTTDSNGEVNFQISSRERVTVQLTYSLVSGRQLGHARVTTGYDEPGTKCVVGGYSLYTSTGGNYGFQAYHIGNGNRF